MKKEKRGQASTPLDVVGSNRGTSGNPSVTATTTNGSDVIVSTLSRFSTTDATTSQSSLFKDKVTSVLGAASYQLATTSGTFTDTYTGSASQDWSMLAAAFRAATSSSGGGASTALAYDQNGNLTSDATSTFAWDYRNQMTQSGNGSATSTYAYDHLGNRVKLVEGGVTTIFPSSLYNVVLGATASSTATTTKHIFANGLNVASIESGGASSGGTSTSTIVLDATSTSITTGYNGGPVTKTWTHTP